MPALSVASDLSRAWQYTAILALASCCFCRKAARPVFVAWEVLAGTEVPRSNRDVLADFCIAVEIMCYMASSRHVVRRLVQPVSIVPGLASPSVLRS